MKTQTNEQSEDSTTWNASMTFETGRMVTDRLMICANGVFTGLGWYIDNPWDIPDSVKDGNKVVIATRNFGNFARFVKAEGKDVPQG